MLVAIGPAFCPAAAAADADMSLAWCSSRSITQRPWALGRTPLTASTRWGSSLDNRAH